MMYDLTGYMVINGKDAWTEYSAFLCEDRPEDSTNVTELLKPPEMKEYTAVDFRERNGEELPQQLPLPRCKPRDLTLYQATGQRNFLDIAIRYALSGCEARRLALMQALIQGWVTLRVKGISIEYRLYYKSATPADILTDAFDGSTVARWKMKFREPKPEPF